MTDTIHKKIGLLLGDEDDWPDAFEALHRRLAPKLHWRGRTVATDVERIRISPFSLTEPTGYNLVIDRLAWWYRVPREWLKKVALLNNTYLLNNPFTFQSMEKHSAYCAGVRLGLHIPETWMVPTKRGPSDPLFVKKYQVTASRYHDLFNLPAIAEKIGYPLYMKPFDGGGWRGVVRINDREDLMRSYDESGESTMHLQKGLDNFEVFVRGLAIGPQVMVMKYDPSKPSHARYQVAHDFLDAEKGREQVIITKLINAFFRWEFNSCESILKDGVLYPIDFANACPDIAVYSLHYYFPWAIKSLLAWSLFALADDRRMRINLDIDKYFEIGDSDRTYAEKLDAYEKLVDEYFQTERFNEFYAQCLGNLDEITWEFMGSKEMDAILVKQIRHTFPPNEQEAFIQHFRGYLRHWVDANASKFQK